MNFPGKSQQLECTTTHHATQGISFQRLVWCLPSVCQTYWDFRDFFSSPLSGWTRSFTTSTQGKLFTDVEATTSRLHLEEASAGRQPSVAQENTSESSFVVTSKKINVTRITVTSLVLDMFSKVLFTQHLYKLQTAVFNSPRVRHDSLAGNALVVLK